ncbi:hypothetical protein ACFRCW_25320 [Streptomyces sp. NPDC056653]|uniref:hypothetical protein n=1 Tax=Streptomyces sp. NPDC056653 TaxID=3345894 RepID=UPI0036892FDA
MSGMTGSAGGGEGRDDWHPLTHGQERLWFLDQLDPADASYNIPLVAIAEPPAPVGIELIDLREGHGVGPGDAARGWCCRTHHDEQQAVGGDRRRQTPHPAAGGRPRRLQGAPRAGPLRRQQGTRGLRRHSVRRSPGGLLRM